MKATRIVAAAGAAAAALAVCVPGATATGIHPNVVINPPANGVVMAAANPTIRIVTPGGVRIMTCNAITITAAVNGAGIVTVAPGGAIFAGCLLGGAAVVVNNPLGWNGNVRHLDNGVGNVSSATLTLNIPFGGIQFAGPFCNGNLSGVLLGEHVLPMPVAHGVPFALPAIGIPAPLANPLGLTVGAAVGLGCAVLGIAAGQPAGLIGTFAISPALRVTG